MSEQQFQGSTMSFSSVPIAPSPLIRAWSVPDVLCPERCRQYIASAETRIWRGSAVDEDSPPTRTVTNANLDIDAVELFEAIRPHVPVALHGLSLLSVPVERVVFLRYGPGECFALHTDAPFRPAVGQRSLFAMLVYLNDDFEGGETHFPDLDLSVKAKAGMALIIPHGLRHEGFRIASGQKYAIHSYILYGRPLLGDT